MTAQQGDKIFFKGVWTYTHSRILESCPANHPLIKNVSLTEAMDSGWDCCTAMIRGYMAEWMVVDNNVFLSSVRGIYQLISTKQIVADWYTGTIVIGGGSSMECQTKTVSAILTVNAGAIVSINHAN